MTQLSRIGILTAFISILAGCNAFMSKVPADAGNTSNSSTAVITSFDQIQRVTLTPKCLGCHSAAKADGNVDLSSYSAIMANPGLVMVGHPENSRIYTEVASGSMPDGGPVLSSNEISAINAWIQAGAPNGDFSSTPPTTPGSTPKPTPLPTPVSGVPSYVEIQTKIFDVSCVRCHAGSKPSGNVNLASYEKLMANSKRVVVPGNALKSSVYTEIERGSMPPRGAGIDSRWILVLKEWIDAGAQKN